MMKQGPFCFGVIGHEKIAQMSDHHAILYISFAFHTKNIVIILLITSVS